MNVRKWRTMKINGCWRVLQPGETQPWAVLVPFSDMNQAMSYARWMAWREFTRSALALAATGAAAR